MVKKGHSERFAPFFFKLKEIWGGENIGHVYFDCLSFAAQNIEGRNISCPIFSSSGSSSSQKTQKEGKLSPFSRRGSIRAATSLLLLLPYTATSLLYLFTDTYYIAFSGAWLLNLFTDTYYIAFSGAWLLYLFTDTYYIAFSGAWLLNLFADTYYIAFFRSLVA